MKLAEMKKLFEAQANQIIQALEEYDLLELHSDKIIGID